MLSGTHLQARGFNVIFGASGSYKTFYALGLALEIARTQGVVYVAAEGSSGLAARIDAWLEYNKLPDPHIAFICREINLLDTKSVTEVLAELKKIKPAVSLVIFDTYARCMDGNENDTKDAGTVVKNCARIQRELNATVLLIHHTGKNGQMERGSTALRGAADVMIEVGISNKDIKISCSKPKETAEWPAEVFRFLPYGESGLLLPAHLVTNTGVLTEQQVKILEFLSLEVFDSPGASIRQIINGVGIAESSVYKIMSELKRNSHVNQDKKGDPYSISAIGEAVLKSQLSVSAKAANVYDSYEIEIAVSNSKPTLN